MKRRAIFQQPANRPSAIAIMALLSVLSVLARSGYAQASSGQANPVDAGEVTKWLKANAMPLKSVVAGSGFADLQPLKKVLKDVKVVGLGEATHGSREFFQFKHRMTEFLVKEMGYTVFAIEASYAACMNINDYVLYGKGDPAQALASQKFWTWDTNEVSDLIEWMRQYNKTAPEGKKVKFLGYDVQHFNQGIDLVVNYLKKVAPEYAEKAEVAFKPLRTLGAEYNQRSQEQKVQTQAQLHELIGFLSFNETRFSRATSPAEFEYVLHHARNVLQYDMSYGGLTRDPKYPFNRDYFMAENIAYLLDQEPAGTRMVVWAHNGHVWLGNLGATPAMGGVLRQMFGDAYYALGFTFNEGGFQSRDQGKEGRGVLTGFVVGPAPEGSGDWYFALPGIPNYVVDFRSAPKTGKVASWLEAALPMRMVGSGYSNDAPAGAYTQAVQLRKYYDGMIYIGKTTRARPNPTGMRGPISTN